MYNEVFSKILGGTPFADGRQTSKLKWFKKCIDVFGKSNDQLNFCFVGQAEKVQLKSKGGCASFSLLDVTAFSLESS